MFEVYRKELTWGGKLLTFETGKIARQADGAVMVTYGGTTVLCTAVGATSAKPGIDFFPLTVNYQEKAFAAGRIPGGFFKREGRPSEIEILNSRLIDRPMRPLFHKDFKNETQIICTVLNYDGENDPAICSMIGASAATTISMSPPMPRCLSRAVRLRWTHTLADRKARPRSPLEGAIPTGRSARAQAGKA